MPPPPRGRVWIALASLYLIWGSTYIAIRFAIESLPPLFMAGTRFILAGGAMVAWRLLRGDRWPRPIHWREAAIVGGLMLLGGNGGVCWAEQTVPSGLAALLVSTVPLWIVLFEWALLRTLRPSPDLLAGVALGISGVALLVRPGSGAGGVHAAVPWAGAVVLVVASMLWALGSLYSRRARLPSSPFLAIGMEMLAGGLILMIAAALLGEWRALPSVRLSPRSLASLLYLVAFGAVVGFTAYIWLLRHTSPALASTYAFVNPIVAMFIGWAIGGEALGARTLLAAALAVSGVTVIILARARMEGRRVPTSIPG